MTRLRPTDRCTATLSMHFDRVGGTVLLLLACLALRTAIVVAIPLTTIAYEPRHAVIADLDEAPAAEIHEPADAFVPPSNDASVIVDETVLAEAPTRALGTTRSPPTA